MRAKLAGRPATAGLVVAFLATLVGWSPAAHVHEARAASPTPVAEWTFDEGSGTTATDTAGGRVGTLSGGTSWLTTDAAQGTGALHFDGVDGAVTVPTSPTLEPGSFTLMFWVRSSDAASTTLRRIVQKNFYGCDIGGSWYADLGGRTMLARVFTTAYPYAVATGTDGRIQAWDGAWHKVAVVFDAPSGRFSGWIDGYASTASLTTPLALRYDATDRLDDDLRLGGAGADCPGEKSFEGDVDDLRLYDVALSDDQVRAEMPVYPTTSTILVEQVTSDDTSSVFVDREVDLESFISPPPAVGETKFYLAKDGGPEILYHTDSIVGGAFGATFAHVPAGTLEPGEYTARAEWVGTPNWLPSASAAKTFTVHRRPVSMTMSATPSQDLPGATTTLTVGIKIIDPPVTTIIPGSIEFHEVTGGNDVLIGNSALTFIGAEWGSNKATLVVNGLSAGAHTYEARYAGSKELLSGTAQTTVTIGPQGARLSLTVGQNPILNTEPSWAFVVLETWRKDPRANAPLPAPTGTLRLERVSDGAVLGSATITDIGHYSFPLAAMPTGSVELVAKYSGDDNFDSSTSQPVTLVIQSDIVDAVGVTTGYSGFYPVIDGYRDVMPIKGVRNEPISVAIRVYNSSNALVKSFSVGSGTGPYSVSWNGRTSSGALLASGTYRVVQTLVDGHGIRRVFTTSVGLSYKRIYYSTKTLAKLGTSLAAVGHVGKAAVVKYSDGSIKLAANGAWAAAGWQFTLPAATTYKSIRAGVYGYTSVPPSEILTQNISTCGASGPWDISNVHSNKSLPYYTGWATSSVSPTVNRCGTAVRVSVNTWFGYAKVYKVRVVVTYGLLR